MMLAADMIGMNPTLVSEADDRRSALIQRDRGV